MGWWAQSNGEVSTHSHPKVAAVNVAKVTIAINGFNTQPPEGGCKSAI